MVPPAHAQSWGPPRCCHMEGGALRTSGLLEGVTFRAEGRPCLSMSSPHVFAPCLKLLDTEALLLRAVCSLGCLTLIPWHHVPGGGPEASIWGVPLTKGTFSSLTFQLGLEDAISCLMIEALFWGVGGAYPWAQSVSPAFHSAHAGRTWSRSPWTSLCASCSRSVMSCGSKARTSRCSTTPGPRP